MRKKLGAKLGALALTASALAAAPAMAFELSGGVSMGGVLAGVVPHFAVSPHVGASWRINDVVRFDTHDLCAVLISNGKEGIGFFNKTSTTLGYASDKFDVDMGPSLSIYRMHACGAVYCGHVVGLSPGAEARASIYFAEPFGVSISANLDWIRGKSVELPNNVAAMVLAGPIVRWSSK